MNIKHVIALVFFFAFCAGACSGVDPEQDESLGSVVEGQTACLRLFGAGVGRVGIRNNCPVCKMAVMSWLNGTTGETTIQRYRVEGNNQIINNMEGISGQLIGEDPC